MIIVSQDKRKIVNFDNLFNIDYYKIDGNFEIDANTENDSVCLGHYKTEERAKEVLDWIVTCYTGDGKIQNDGFVCMEMPKE